MAQQFSQFMPPEDVSTDQLRAYLRNNKYMKYVINALNHNYKNGGNCLNPNFGDFDEEEFEENEEFAELENKIIQHNNLEVISSYSHQSSEKTSNDDSDGKSQKSEKGSGTEQVVVKVNLS